MDARLRLTPAIVALALLGAPAGAHADASWSCSAGAGWVSDGSLRRDAPGVGGTPCPVQQAEAGGVAGPNGTLAAEGTIAVDGGSASQTTDARRPTAVVDAKTIEIRDADGLTLNVSKLSARAQGACDPSRRPTFTSTGSPGTVTLNGHPIDSSREYSEPGLGVNGAPLFGKITVRFGEVTKTDTGISRREIHVIVTDRDGATVFEAAAGEVAAGRDGAVCDPPPICPPGQEPQAGRCVEVTVAPLPPPPAPTAPPVPGTPGAGQPPPKSRGKGCRDINARARQVSVKRIAAATLCLMNARRREHHLGRLRASTELARAAAGHAREMVAHHFFSHASADGGNVLDRILRCGYLKRFGNWRIGENLGWGWASGATPRLIVRAWMRSPSHRRNILTRRFRDAGVAAMLGSPGRRKPGSITYVVDFGGSG